MSETIVTFPPTEHFTRAPRATASWFEECQMEAEEWLVERLVPRGSYTGIFGRRGAAKSFLALELACCGATGRPFLGEEVERFGSVYCVGEKKNRFGKRIQAYRLSRGIDRLPIQFRWGVPNLLDDEAVGDFIADLEAARADFLARGAPLGAVFLDTLSRSLNGANVSDADATGTALSSIQRIIDETGVTVLPLAHVAKAEGSYSQKGAGEWEDAADALIRIDRKDDAATLRTVTLTKQSDEADGLAYGFELEIVDVGETPKGRRVTSCVIRQVDLPLSNGASIKLSGGGLIARDALAYLVDHDLTVEAPAWLANKLRLKHGQAVVEVEQWKRRAAEMGLSDREDSDTNRRQKWFAAKSKVRDAGLVNIEGDYAVPLGPLGGVRP